MPRSGKSRLKGMNKITVLFLDHTGWVKGGGQISLLTLLSYLAGGDFRPILVAPSSESEVASRARKLNVSLEVFPLVSLKNLNLIAIFKSLLKVWRISRREKVDIIHANTSRAMWYGGIVGRLLRLPVIWHVRIAESDGFIDRVLASLSTRVIAISRFVAERRFPWLSEKKLTVIYNGVDLLPFDRAKPTLREELKIGEDDLLIGTIAQLQPKKRIKDFILLASKVIRDCPNVRFVVVGADITGGEYLSRLKEIVSELGIGKKVFFLGFRKDIPKIVRSLDLFVITSLDEPFGRVVIEAMAGSLPVVAYRSGAIPEIVEDGEEGILVPPCDIEMMASAVLSLLKDERKRLEMGKRGRKKVERLFSAECHIKEIKRLYRTIMESKG